MNIEFKGKRLSTSYDQPEVKKEGAKGKITAIKGRLLIDGNGGTPTNNPVIVLEGNLITAVGTESAVEVPAGAEVIDCSQYTLMPGMMDLHIHTAMFNCLTFHNYRVAQWEIAPELQQMYSLFN